MLILNNFGNQKMDFLTMDKIFVLDNMNIVLDKKYFVRADGRGIIATNPRVFPQFTLLCTDTPPEDGCIAPFAKSQQVEMHPLHPC